MSYSEVIFHWISVAAIVGWIVKLAGFCDRPPRRYLPPPDRSALRTTNWEDIQ